MDVINQEYLETLVFPDTVKVDVSGYYGETIRMREARHDSEINIDIDRLDDLKCLLENLLEYNRLNPNERSDVHFGYETYESEDEGDIVYEWDDSLMDDNDINKYFDPGAGMDGNYIFFDVMEKFIDTIDIILGNSNFDYNKIDTYSLKSLLRFKNKKEFIYET